MSLKSSAQGSVQIVTVEAERIDVAMAIRFKDDMCVETENWPDRVTLDLSGVDFVDSSGLGAIVAAMKQLEARQAELESRGVPLRCLMCFVLFWRMYPVSTFDTGASDAFSTID